MAYCERERFPALVPLLLWTAGALISLGSAAQESVSLAPISVTATRSPMRAFEFPGMVSVHDRTDIEASLPSTVDDVLRLTPGVEFTGGPRRTGEVPSIRGFEGPDVVVLIDGARQNFGSAHDGRFFVDPSFLREAEVLRGTASSLYGSGGTGGVLELRTVEPSDLLRADASFGLTAGAAYQSVNGERQGTLIGAARPVPEFDLLGAVTARSSGTIRLGDGTRLRNTDDDVVSGLAKARLRLGSHQELEASWHRFANDAQEPNNGQGLGSPDRVDKAVRATNLRLAYRFSAPANSLADLSAVLYRTEFGVDERRLDGNGAGPVGELLRRDVDTVGLRVENRSRLVLGDVLRTTLTYGLETYTDRQDGAAGAGERDGVPDAEATFFGAFLQGELSVAEPFGVLPGDLLLIPGVRYDRFRIESPLAAGSTHSEISSRAGVSYLPADWLLVFAAYGQAFRAPSFDEMFLTGTHFVIPIGPALVVNRFTPNPDLEPQRTETFEAGLGVAFENLVWPADRFELKASHFTVQGENFIDLAVTQPAPFLECTPFIPGGCDGTTTSRNIPSAALWGTELEGRYQSRHLRVRIGYSNVTGKDKTTGRKLGTLTPPQLDADLSLHSPSSGLAVGWRIHAAAEFDKVDDPSEVRDGYVVNDLYATWAPRTGALSGLRVDVGVDNVFDKAFSRVFTGATEPGRNFKAALSYAVRW